MTEMHTARVAILADSPLQRHVLQQVLADNGYHVVLNSDPERFDEAAWPAVATDLWLIDLSQTEESPLVDALLEGAEVPILFGEGQAPERFTDPFTQWEKRLIGKLKRLIGDPVAAVGPALETLLQDQPRPPRLTLPEPLANLPLPAGDPAPEVWLLAASLGGPAAVKAFLDALPGGLPVGFLYAQHIGDGFAANLLRAVGRHSQWHIQGVRPGEPVRCGEVVVVPTQQELTFRANGALDIVERAWPEPYTPSISQMMLNLAQHFGARCGVIVFSGMGNDGTASAPYVRRRGGTLWTQSASTCIAPSMPESLRESGLATLTADPRGLAEALVARLAEQQS